MWSKLAVTSFFLGLGFLMFNMFDAFLGFGSSRKFTDSPQSLVDFLGSARFDWIDSIPSVWGQTLAGYFVQVPLFAVLLYLSAFSLLIYFILPGRKDRRSAAAGSPKTRSNG